MTSVERQVAGGLVGLLVVIIAVLYGAGWYATHVSEGASRYSTVLTRRSFDRTLWNASTRLDQLYRYRMVPSLLQTYDSFAGWPRADVEALVGPMQPSRAERTLDAAGALEVYAGEQYGGDIDPVRVFALRFRLDRRGRVQNVEFRCSGPRC